VISLPRESGLQSHDTARRLPKSTTLLTSYERSRLVRYEPSGEARVENENGEAQSNWLSAQEIDDICQNPGLVARYAASRPSATPGSYPGVP
jgi:hypothetical protein